MNTGWWCWKGSGLIEIERLAIQRRTSNRRVNISTGPATDEFHDAMPDRRGTSNTDDIIAHCRIISVTGPDTYNDIRCIANRPVIFETICCTRFGGNLMIHAVRIRAARNLAGGIPIPE